MAMGFIHINGTVSNFNTGSRWIQVKGNNGLKYKLLFDDDAQLKKYIKNKQTPQVFTVKYGNVFLLKKRGKQIQVK